MSYHLEQLTCNASCSAQWCDLFRIVIKLYAIPNIKLLYCLTITHHTWPRTLENRRTILSIIILTNRLTVFTYLHSNILMQPRNDLEAMLRWPLGTGTHIRCAVCCVIIKLFVYKVSLLAYLMELNTSLFIKVN